MNKFLKRREFLSRLSMSGAAVGLSPLTRLFSLPLSGDFQGIPKRVIIIGAGLAGLSAGYELKKTGHQVTILEARNRPGGKVFTLREPFSTGLYTEGGGIAFGGDIPLLKNYAALFNLTLQSIPSSKNESLYYVRGQLVRAKANVPPQLPYDLGEEYKGKGQDEIMFQYIAPLLKTSAAGLSKDVTPDSLTKYDNLSFSAFMQQNGASKEVQALMDLPGSMDIIGEENGFSLLGLLKSAAALSGGGGGSYGIQGGNDLLPKAFADRLKNELHYNTPVKRIEQSADAVSVLYTDKGKDVYLKGDYLVAAIPFTVLKSLEVFPSFSPPKQKAVNELAYTSVGRVFLQTKEKYWIKDGLSGDAYSDSPRLAFYESNPLLSGDQGILEAFITGSQARQFGSLGREERIKFAVEAGKKFFPQLPAQLQKATSLFWDEEEWSKGGWVWFKPGQITGIEPFVNTVEGRIHFATSLGGMYEALEAGNRVSKEINAIG